MQSPSSQDQAGAVFRDFGWFLRDIDIGTRSFVFVRTTRAEISEQTFLDPRWSPRSGETLRLEADLVLDAMEKAAPASPVNVIWHTALCCSTLIAKLLDAPGRNLSLREPTALVTLADAVRNGAFDAEVLPRACVEAVLRLLGKADEPQSKVTIKPSNLANNLAREVPKHMPGNALFLYVDLPGFLVAIANGGASYGKFVQIVVEKVSRDLGRTLPWSPAEWRALPPLHVACVAWHLQIAEMRRSWAAYGEANVASLNCEAFLAAPERILQALDGFFGIELGRDHIRSVVQGPLMAHHAKSPGHRFSPQMRADESRAIRERLGPNLDRAIAWSRRYFPETDLDMPLPNPLVDVSAV